MGNNVNIAYKLVIEGDSVRSNGVPTVRLGKDEYQLCVMNHGST